MFALYDFFTFSILSVVAIRYILKIFRTNMISSIGLVYLAIFVAYGVPIMFRYIGMGGYYNATFNEALLDPTVHWKYNLIVLAGVCLLWLTNIKGPLTKLQGFSWQSVIAELPTSGFMTFFAWLIIFMPILIILFLAPDKSAYLRYGNLATREIEGTQGRFARNLTAYAVRFVLPAYLLVRHSEYVNKKRIWTFPAIIATFFMIVNAYIDGKRAFMLFTLAAVGFFGLIYGSSKKILILLIPFVLIFFSWYMVFGKTGDISSEASFKGFIKGDLSRDYTLSYTISKSKWTKNDIIPWRGNTFLWLATEFLPRRIFTFKEWHTGRYFTLSVFNRSILDAPTWQWGFGIGYYEEFLLNFGYMGLLLFIPLGLLLRYLDRLIYFRTPVYAAIWIPVLYNVGFGMSMKIYTVLVLPVLVVGYLLNRKARRIKSELYYSELENSYIN